MKKGILVLLVALVCASNAYAAQFFHDGAELGHSEEVNCSTGLDCGKVAGKMVISIEEPLSLDDATVETITVTYYATLPYYSRLNFPGSGAPVGSLITRGGPAGNCGGDGDGTTVNVCVSDGTNFKLV
jgi:hypothetical protein